MEISTIKTTFDAINKILDKLISARIDEKVRESVDSLNSFIRSLQGEMIGLQGELFTLQGKLFDLQAENQEITKQKQQLEQELKQMYDWKIEADKYELVEICPGVKTYVRKPDCEPKQPQHMICANCFEQGKKSFLQRFKKDFSGTHYECHRCKNTLIDHSQSQDASF